MTAIQVIDDFGIWDDLGIIIPYFEQWQPFPRYSLSDSNLIKLVFGGDLENSQSFAFIRSTYVINNLILKAPWLKIFPKVENEFLLYPHPQEFNDLSVSPQRFFEVQKRHFKRGYTGTFEGSIWTLNLQVSNYNFSSENNDFEEDFPSIGFF